jgi:hypothetical protein
MDRHFGEALGLSSILFSTDDFRDSKRRGKTRELKSLRKKQCGGVEGVLFQNGPGRYFRTETQGQVILTIGWQESMLLAMG